MSDKMREEFEIAYVMHICGCDADRAKSKIKRLDGEGLLARHSEVHDFKYCLQSTDDAWWAWQASRAAMVQEGWKLVPVELIERFPEINPSNYGHDDVCAINDLGVQVVLSVK